VSDPVLDLTGEPPVGPTAGTAPALATTPYDPSQDREHLRGTLAKLLLALLTVVAIGPVVALIFDKIDVATLKDILAGVFTPLLAVFGTITGFYFGNAQASQPPQRGQGPVGPNPESPGDQAP